MRPEACLLGDSRVCPVDSLHWPPQGPLSLCCRLHPFHDDLPGTPFLQVFPVEDPAISPPSGLSSKSFAQLHVSFWYCQVRLPQGTLCVVWSLSALKLCVSLFSVLLCSHLSDTWDYRQFPESLVIFILRLRSYLLPHCPTPHPGTVLYSVKH